MQKRTREILALILLGVFALIAACSMGYFVLVGHNWNVTASNIDDSIGQLEGYTVFVYSGTNPSPEQREHLSDAQPVLDDESRGNVTRDWSAKPSEPITTAEVVANYREKGALVFELDFLDFNLYSEPIIVGKGGKRVGFFSVLDPFRKTVARVAVRDLQENGAENIVALTNDAGLCDADIKGLTIIVCNDDEGESPDGEYRGSSYCVGVPYVGEVEAILMAPSGVLSSKTITEL